MKTTIFTTAPMKEEYASFDKQPEIIEKIQNLETLKKIPGVYMKVIDLSNILQDPGNEVSLNFIIGTKDPEFTLMDDDIESYYVDPINNELTDIFRYIFRDTYDSDYIYEFGVYHTNNEITITIIATKLG